MMGNPTMQRFFAIPLAALLLLSSWGGCASGRSDLLARYDALPYTDTFAYGAPTTDIMRIISDAMYARGGTVTMIDHRTGIMTAMIETADELPEEAHATAGENEQTVIAAVFAGIVAFFLFIILFGWLGDACGSSDKDDEDDDERSRGRRRQPPDRIEAHEWDPPVDIYIGHDAVEPVRGFRYVLSFTITPESFGKTRVRIRSLRQESENGVIVRSTNMQNKYLLYALDEKIRAELARQ